MFVSAAGLSFLILSFETTGAVILLPRRLRRDFRKDVFVLFKAKG